MRVGVLGTGIVGRTVAGKLVELGHDVSIGTRDPEALAQRTEPDYMGNPPFPVWQADHPNVGVATFEEVASRSELVVNATNGAGSLEALGAAGERNLDGKILIDVSNPLDFSHGMPPSLSFRIPTRSPNRSSEPSQARRSSRPSIRWRRR